MENILARECFKNSLQGRLLATFKRVETNYKEETRRCFVRLQSIIGIHGFLIFNLGTDACQSRAAEGGGGVDLYRTQGHEDASTA